MEGAYPWRMTDAELSARMRENLVAYKQLQGADAALRHLSLPGVEASALLPQPTMLFQQMVVYTHPEALAEALGPLDAFFREHRIPAWRVSVPTGDAEAERLLSRAGYHPADVVRVMGLTLDALPVAPPSLPLERPRDMRTLIALNEEAFGERMLHTHLWREHLPPGLHVAQLREAGRPVAGGAALDAGDSAGIYLVATVPSARRRGLASEVMRGLLHDARARGLAASVLQSTELGHGVYKRLGYRDVDGWTNWVRRATV